MKQTPSICVVFMAISLAIFVSNPGIPSAFIFACSASLLAFVLYLDRNKRDEIKELREQVKLIHTQVQNTEVRLGWG